MAVHSESSTNQSFFPKRRRQAQTSGLHLHKYATSSTDAAPRASFGHALNTLLEKLSVSLWVLLAIVVVSSWVATGFVLGKLFPEYMVTVQQFEVSPEIANRFSLSGKNASDIVVDVLNDSATHASQFHGTEYYKYWEAETQPIALHQAIKVPVQTSYGIELKGISLDSLLQLYYRKRYQQWVISGDILSSPNGLIGRIRLNQGDAAQSWETPPSSRLNPAELVRDATYLMLSSVSPELLGQAYLQQANYEDAIKVFRQWAVGDPRNWKPTYYLSLAYSYQNKGPEASDLAAWSEHVEEHEANTARKETPQTRNSKNMIASNLATTTRFVSETTYAPDSDSSSSSKKREKLEALHTAESKLAALLKSAPESVDYRIQRARILDDEAVTEANLNPGSPKAIEWVNQAIDSIDLAIQQVPENGGLHEQRAIFLMHFVSILKDRNKESSEIREKQKEEIREYVRALELKPTESSPLWGAVNAEIDLGEVEEAVHLARTISLLQPNSTAASTAYIYSLELAVQHPEKEQEREKEIEVRLRQLLQAKPDESQLDVLWYAFAKNNNRNGLTIIAADAKRRFPIDPNVNESKSYRRFQNTAALNFSAPILGPR